MNFLKRICNYNLTIWKIIIKIGSFCLWFFRLELKGPTRGGPMVGVGWPNSSPHWIAHLTNSTVRRRIALVAPSVHGVPQKVFQSSFTFRYRHPFLWCVFVYLFSPRRHCHLFHVFPFLPLLCFALYFLPLTAWILFSSSFPERTTMKKKALLTPPRRLFWFSWKLLVAFSLALCILALISLHSSPSTTDLAAASLSRRSRPPSDSFLGRPKIAFLFLTRRNLPLDFLWGSFFEVFISFLSR